MPTVLTMASIVTCGHPPGAVDTKSDTKLQVDGQPVLLEASIAGRPLKPGTCGTPVTGPLPSAKCLKVATVAATSLATKLHVGGKPVVVDTLQGTTDGTVAGTPQTLLAVTSANQSKLASV